jgi:head-tail adaptor
MPPQNPLAMPAGTRQPFDVQAKTGPADANGEATWQTVLPAMGIFATGGSREVTLQRQFTGQTTHIITMVYPYMTIDTGMRVCFKGRILTIIAPPENVQERNRILKLNCAEIGDSGAIA